MIELAVILNLLTYLFLAVKYSWNSFFLSYWNKRDLIGWSTISIVSSFVLLFTIQVVSCLFFRFFTIFQDSLFFHLATLLFFFYHVKFYYTWVQLIVHLNVFLASRIWWGYPLNATHINAIHSKARTTNLKIFLLSPILDFQRK